MDKNTKRDDEIFEFIFVDGIPLASHIFMAR